jgi:hypothetical protein
MSIMRCRVVILNAGWNDAMPLDLFSREICIAVPSGGDGTPPRPHIQSGRTDSAFPSPGQIEVAFVSDSELLCHEALCRTNPNHD